jgi:uncharacterized SAM-binding protein YcdF (DUF218 family)
MIANPAAGPRPQRPWWRRFSRILGLVLATDLLASSVWVVLCAWVATDAGARADAIVVLWGDQATPGAETERRVARTLDLWRTGRGNRVICVGGSRLSARFNGARVMADALAALGVPASALTAGDRSYDTLSNLDEARDLARRHDANSMLVVGDALHVARIMLFHERRVAPLTVSSGAYPVGTNPRALPRLWLRVHHEWIALATLAIPDGWRAYVLRRLRG